MLNTSFSPWPSFTEEDAAAVSRLLLSNRVNYWTGDECRAFEREFAEWAGSRHAVALANGTVALDLALKGLAVGPGDEVVVTPRTFLASVSCVVNAGATPVFADVDRDSGNVTAETIDAVLTERTKAVLPVHLAGWPCDMDPIMELAERRNFKVIEDCAQAHGARYKGRSVGSIGHVGAWSFCQDKIMTTGGEGGIVTTDDRDLWSKMWSFKDHGKSWDAVYEREHPPGFRWVHESFGTNWRMLELQAAIGRIQLGNMSSWTAIRQRNADKIANALFDFTGEGGVIRIPFAERRDFFSNNTCHGNYKFYAYVKNERLASGWDRDRIVAQIQRRGVPCYHGSCPEVYLERAFDNTSWRPVKRLPTAKELGETSIMLLVHPTLTEAEIAKTCEVVSEVLFEASH